jgi:hypothetical protein
MAARQARASFAAGVVAIPEARHDEGETMKMAEEIDRVRALQEVARSARRVADDAEKGARLAELAASTAQHALERELVELGVISSYEDH